jgi:hypothetical protein
MRQRTENLERNSQEQAEYIRALEARLNPPQPEVDELQSIARDEWVTREQHEKLTERQTQAALKKWREEWEREQLEAQKKKELEELPSRLNKEMPDFDQVVSQKNVEYLKATNPHVAAVLAMAEGDPYSQAKAAYTVCKSFCASPEVQKDKEAIKQNAMKPGSLDEVGTPRTDTADPRRFRPGDRERRWQAMQQAGR